MPFALPALFLVLVAPRFTTRRWSLALGSTIAIAALLTVDGLTHVAIPLAAARGALCYYLVRFDVTAQGKQNG